MAFIPNDAQWYLAELVLESSVQDDSRNVVHVNIHLVRADSQFEAYDKAVKLGRESEQEYINTDGLPVRIRFRGLRDLNVIHDSLEDGAELTFEKSVAVPQAKLESWLTPKDQLGIFRDTETKHDLPNLMPESVMRSLESEGFSRDDLRRTP